MIQIDFFQGAVMEDIHVAFLAVEGDRPARQPLRLGKLRQSASPQIYSKGGALATAITTKNEKCFTGRDETILLCRQKAGVGWRGESHNRILRSGIGKPYEFTAVRG